jgi:hypothetical protein
VLLEEESGCLTVEDGVGYAVEYSLCRWHDSEDLLVAAAARGNVNLLLLVVQ